MKIVEESIRRITISQVQGLDPIRVALEDIGPGQGRINIECWGQSWANYWGGMGKDTIAVFFATADEHYLAGKLSNIDSTVFDPDHLVNVLKREVIVERRKWEITSREARSRFDTIADLDLPEHEAQLWGLSDAMTQLLGDEWWYRLPKKANPNYDYLCRIIRTVQAALRQELES